jgi:arsenite methyltransferase
MIEAARQNAANGAYENVEFRLGEIENLPVADATVDLVISNCVVNLSVDKRRVFKETFRVLKPGGRLMISDIILNHPLPEKIVGSSQAYCQCISGAVLREDYLGMIGEAGFADVEIKTESPYSASFIVQSPEYESAPGKINLTEDEVESAAEALVSAGVYARKPG